MMLSSNNLDMNIHIPIDIEVKSRVMRIIDNKFDSYIFELRRFYMKIMLDMVN